MKAILVALLFLASCGVPQSSQPVPYDPPFSVAPSPYITQDMVGEQRMWTVHCPNGELAAVEREATRIEQLEICEVIEHIEELAHEQHARKDLPAQCPEGQVCI